MALTMKVEGADALKSDIFYLKKRFERFNKQGVSIGYIEAKSLRRKDSPVTNLKIATWQTYGTHTIPPRPYLKPALLTNEKRIHEILEQALVDEGLSGKTETSCRWRRQQSRPVNVRTSKVRKHLFALARFLTLFNTP